MHNTHESPLLGGDDVFILPTLDGSDTLFSKAFNTTYHSTKGAVSESRHVFIQHGLQHVSFHSTISILEIGFGTGLNAFLSFLFSKKYNKEIFYRGLESFPLQPGIAEKLNYPSYLAADAYKDIFLKMHTESVFSEDLFHFEKFTSLDDLIGDRKVDSIFFDAFSPDVHPQLWEQNIFDRLFEMTSTNGCLVTYCAKGEVRRRMERSGYHVNRLPGAPGKREMIQAIKK